MTEPALLWTVGIIALALVIPAVIYRDKDYAPYMLGAAGILAIIIGVMMLGSPLAYPTGTTITTTPTGYTVTQKTVPVPTYLNTALGLIVVITGLAGILAGVQAREDIKEQNLDDGIRLPKLQD